MKAKSLHSNFKKLDLFGEGVSFNFNGESSFGTILGALFSLMVLSTVLLYG